MAQKDKITKGIAEEKHAISETRPRIKKYQTKHTYT